MTDSGWLDGFLSSWSMILVSEIGDKTFFIACLMAMRHPRLIVFIGAIAALSAMTVLSALMGVIFPSVLSVKVTQVLAFFLFTGFGIKILVETCKTPHGEDDHGEEEMAEAAAALGKKSDDNVESGNGSSPNGLSPPAARWASFLSPVLIQAFTLTFVAEWGDRSQIATIALAAAKNPYGVTLGGIVGHSICTGGAVLSGNLIASRVSHRTVNIIGGILFIFFGLMTLVELASEESRAHLTIPPVKRM
jgi:putative Ca2+/H+ antiporter (TMEM165/GDT1 family)